LVFPGWAVDTDTISEAWMEPALWKFVLGVVPHPG